MRKPVWLVILPFLAGGIVGFAAEPAMADWAVNNCNNNGPSTPSSWARENARSYAATANGDGYDWGGGCWNSNGVDDTPSQNTSMNSVGEGPDCSGLTFKSWALALDFSFAKRRWAQMTDVHGPYTAADFKAGVGASNPLANRNYSTTGLMDAFASSSHIGMIYTEGSGGTDTIVEAKDQQINTGIFTRGYRTANGFVGVKRATWDPYCPQCG